VLQALQPAPLHRMGGWDYLDDGAFCADEELQAARQAAARQTREHQPLLQRLEGLLLQCHLQR
jgi:hypothetical protein